MRNVVVATAFVALACGEARDPAPQSETDIAPLNTDAACENGGAEVTIAIRDWESGAEPQGLSVAACRYQNFAEWCALVHGDELPLATVADQVVRPGDDVDYVDIARARALPSSPPDVVFVSPAGDELSLVAGSVEHLPITLHLNRRVCGATRLDDVHMVTTGALEALVAAEDDASRVSAQSSVVLARIVDCAGTVDANAEVSIGVGSAIEMPTLTALANASRAFFFEQGSFEAQVVIDAVTFAVPVRAGQLTVVEAQQPGCN